MNNALTLNPNATPEDLRAAFAEIYPNYESIVIVLEPLLERLEELIEQGLPAEYETVSQATALHLDGILLINGIDRNAEIVEGEMLESDAEGEGEDEEGND